jgi:hypothetical protein
VQRFARFGERDLVNGRGVAGGVEASDVDAVGSVGGAVAHRPGDGHTGPVSGDRDRRLGERHRKGAAAQRIGDDRVADGDLSGGGDGGKEDECEKH